MVLAYINWCGIYTKKHSSPFLNDVWMWYTLGFRVTIDAHARYWSWPTKAMEWDNYEKDDGGCKINSATICGHI